MSINEKSKVIFSENYIGSMATVNSDGSPWSSPLHMVSDDEYVYWLSAPNKRHSQNIERDPRVHLTLFSPYVGRGLQGVYISGQAEHLPADHQPAVYQLMLDRVGIDRIPRGMENSDAYRLPIGELDTERTTGNCWYFYS